MTAPATIHSIATALPRHRLPAAEASERLGEVFARLGEDPALVAQVIENSGIATRYLAREPEFYLEVGDLTRRNQAYHEAAIELGVAACRDALDAAGVEASEVDLIVDTSCTGLMIPALDVYVAGALGLREDVRRVPLTEVGCAAGATALALAADHLRAYPGATVLTVSVELPSLTLQLQDDSRANLVSAAIFGDGASALVLRRAAPPTRSVEHLAHATVLFPDTPDIMGFRLETEGLKIVLSRRIPLLVRRELRSRVDAFLAQHETELAELSFFALHPGGTKVLDGVRDVLGLQESQAAASRAVLRRYGNLSSASIHYVLRELLDQGQIEPGALGLMVAMGPGFTLELALLRGV